MKNPADTEYDINYSERSPLVVPPTRNLPPPVDQSRRPAPNWPKDPDVAKRKAKKNDDKPVIQQYDRAAEADRALRPDELNNVSRDPRSRRRSGHAGTERAGEQGEAQAVRLQLDQSQQDGNRDLYRRAAAPR